MVAPFFAFDLETIPAQDLPPGVRPEFREEDVSIPANWKDPYKINEKINQERERFEAALDKKMATDPDLCQIVCAVGYSARTGRYLTPYAESVEEEIGLINSVWDFIRTAYNDGIPLVTFNGISFDFPVMVRRSMILDISVPPLMISHLMQRQEYNRHHYDLMQLLAFRSPFSGKPEIHGLDYYLKRFGLGSKENMNGGDVYPLFKEGRRQEIVDYCKDDVERTVRLFERVSPWLVAPRIALDREEREKKVA